MGKRPGSSSVVEEPDGIGRVDADVAAGVLERLVDVGTGQRSLPLLSGAEIDSAGVAAGLRALVAMEA